MSSWMEVWKSSGSDMMARLNMPKDVSCFRDAVDSSITKPGAFFQWYEFAEAVPMK